MHALHICRRLTRNINWAPPRFELEQASPTELRTSSKIIRCTNHVVTVPCGVLVAGTRCRFSVYIGEFHRENRRKINEGERPQRTLTKKNEIYHTAIYRNRISKRSSHAVSEDIRSSLNNLARPTKTRQYPSRAGKWIQFSRRFVFSETFLFCHSTSAEKPSQHLRFFKNFQA